jgi:tRNA dimethylallyltransferase
MRPIILILGPTAGGKTSLSIELGKRLPGGGECICADSMQVYRGMDIGTAKPAEDELATIPHHLLNIADPLQDGFTVDNWLTLANKAVEDVQNRGLWPIVVGGTNLYIQSLLFGMFDGPKSDPEIRSALETNTNMQLHERLLILDPEAASRIHVNDRRRMVRAIEVCEVTGEPLSLLQTQWTQSKPRNEAIIIGLSWKVEAINRRINARVAQMMEQGFLDEVRMFDGKLGRQAREALGYKQLLAHISGEYTLEDAIEQIKILTRRFAKQQRNWLRRFKLLPHAKFIDVDESTTQDVSDKVLIYITTCHAYGL